MFKETFGRNQKTGGIETSAQKRGTASKAQPGAYPRVSV